MLIIPKGEILELICLFDILLILQFHFGRSFIIFVVNVPIWFSVVWRIVKPLIHENTQKKVRVLSRSQTLQGLQEHIDISQIPVYYGGQLDFGGRDSCRFHSPETVAMNEFVAKLNNKQGPNPRDSKDMSQPDQFSPGTDSMSDPSIRPGSGSPGRLSTMGVDRRPSILGSDVSTSYGSSNNSVQPPSPSQIRQPISSRHPTAIAGEVNRRGPLGTVNVNPLSLDQRDRENRANGRRQ